MTKDEFINACVSLGYSSRRVAAQYAESRAGELSDDDFEEVYRLYQRFNKGRIGYQNDKWRNYQGTKSTKFLPKYTSSI